MAKRLDLNQLLPAESPYLAAMSAAAKDKLSAAWRSPSNIAIVKYWGKHGEQMADNPSLSITLSEAYTETSVTCRPQSTPGDPEVQFLFDGQPQPHFEKRIIGYVSRLRSELPFLTGCVLEIASGNAFPHSAGIASSASAMSALALCLLEIQYAFDGRTRDAHFFREVSRLARLGSGSACRSLYGPVCLWGEVSSVPGSSAEIAVPIQDIHPVFATMQDCILIIDDGQKEVSSSAGHTLMREHLFRDARIAQAHRHLDVLLPAMRTGDLETFGAIAEAEALTLHALMMTSDPSYVLMRANTLEAIRRIRAFRGEHALPLYFTLDAGPNVHVLYPLSSADRVVLFIRDALRPLCVDRKMIVDRAGTGPVRVDG